MRPNKSACPLCNNTISLQELQQEIEKAYGYRLEERCSFKCFHSDDESILLRFSYWFSYSKQRISLAISISALGMHQHVLSFENMTVSYQAAMPAHHAHAAKDSVPLRLHERTALIAC